MNAREALAELEKLGTAQDRKVYSLLSPCSG